MNTVLIIAKDQDAFYAQIVKRVRALGIKIVTKAFDADFTIVLGGDGTVLGATRTGVKSPVLVINTGHLGFLTSTSKENAFDAIDRMVSGEFLATERHFLYASIGLPVDPVSKALTGPFVYHALNDIVIRPGASDNRNLSRLIRLSVFVTEDGSEEQQVAYYKADGLIISTPTGSTAYSLSAGGPIIHPSCRTLLVTPICPQGLTQRPLVLPYETKIRIEPHDDDLFLSVDGQVGQEIGTGPSVYVAYNSMSVLTVNPTSTYYQVLQNKLSWGSLPVKL